MQAHAAVLHDGIDEALRAPQVDGFDERRLLRFELSDLGRLDELGQLPGVEFISQEHGSVVLGFVDEEALGTFEARLATMMRGGTPARAALLYALRAISAWTRADRVGRALARFNVFRDIRVVDVELWPLEVPLSRRALLSVFRAWLADKNIEVLDSVERPELLLYRVLLPDGDIIEDLLSYRDVRLVDLPPVYTADLRLAQTTLGSQVQLLPPDTDSPRIVILDSGVQENHPLLASAIGESETFIPEIAPNGSDDFGHGTHVAGLALYEDPSQLLTPGTIKQRSWILSGRILDSEGKYRVEIDEHGRYNTRFIANVIENAVQYFVEQHGAKIFNLSIGDAERPYRGGRLDGLAVTLDRLSRDYNVLFIVAVGNLFGYRPSGDGQYPAYLFNDDASVLDPGAAMNALTVGSLARFEASQTALRYPNDPRQRPVARRDEPSPFTRSGPTVNNAIKPDLVDYGGNWAYDVTTGATQIDRGLGELSSALIQQSGTGMGMRVGTSCAVPHVTYKAARILEALPTADALLIRAILGAHAERPDAARLLGLDSNNLRRLYGLGYVDDGALAYSLSNEVTLYSVDLIANQSHHFYELPIPDEYFRGGRRTRNLTVALSHFAPVRTTRLAYKAVRLSFRLVAADLQTTVMWYNAETNAEELNAIAEFGTGRDANTTEREGGTLQVATWKFLQGRTHGRQLTLVVTRYDQPWAGGLAADQEQYALAIKVTDRLASEAYLYDAINIRLRQQVRVTV